MQRTKFLLGLILSSLFYGSAFAEKDCNDLVAPRQLGFPVGQDGAAILGPLKRVKPPTRVIPFPSGPIESISISLDRSGCEGSCPSYSVELHGDGSAKYIGNSYVLVKGTHEFDISGDSVRCLVDHFKRANFWSLRNEYEANNTADGSHYAISLTIGGKKKVITDYFGPAVGMPLAIRALEEEIDRIGADQWVYGTSDTIPNLQKEGFDFHSEAAANMLAEASASAQDDFVLGLIEAGAPVTGEARDHAPAVVRASGAGRTAVVKALIARGAFSVGPPPVKEPALRAAASSGNPEVVAEILQYHPDVNSQDSVGDTALIRMGNPRYFQHDKSKMDVERVARLLLDAGADPNLTNHSGENALFFASNSKVLSLLIEAGAKINVVNEFGSTPLLHAESDESAVTLIKAGADINVTSKFGETIKKRAIEKKFNNTLQLLKGMKSKND